MKLWSVFYSAICISLVLPFAVAEEDFGEVEEVAQPFVEEAPTGLPDGPPPALANGLPALVHVVPVTAEISKPNLFILRRSLKQAISEGAEVVVLNMDTPGGRLDVTMDMMELLDRFEGTTITFVNKDAISAGAYIAMATDEIYFAPNGVMGAAAVVSGGGQEIDESMKAKINSYLLARMRSYTGQFRYRGEVIRAMADLDYVLEIDERVLKAEGELLSLTATEAVELFGDPPVPLLAEGIAADIEDLLRQHFGDRPFEIVEFQTTWSEELAKYLSSIAPILLGLGLLALFVEFKTPGFGVAGIAGIVLISIVFASNYVAGLAGMEALLFFMLGLALVVVEFLVLPGTFIFLFFGVLLIIGSLIWSLSDIWPTQPNGEDTSPISFTVEADALWGALYQLLGAFAIALLGLIIVWRYLPQTAVFSRLVLTGASGSPDLIAAGGGEVYGSASSLPDVGSKGIVTRDMHPLGEVEIDGKRFQASVPVGSLARGSKIIVVGYRSFNLLVDKDEGAHS